MTKNTWKVAALVLFMLLPLLAAAGWSVSGATTTRTYPVHKPPWYRGEVPANVRVAFAPARAAGAPIGTPAEWWPSAALERLAADVTARLAAREGLRPLEGDLAREGAPEVSVGCPPDDSGSGECATEVRELVMAVTGPTKKWRDALPPALQASGAGHVLLITVEIRDHWLRQKDWKGRKEVPLGTGHAQPAPWLTSLDTPVQVLQITGVVVDPAGKPVRSGVEGVYASRTRFDVSTLGAQKMITTDEVEAARTSLRRGEAAEGLLAWEAALDELLRGLLGR